VTEKSPSYTLSCGLDNTGATSSTPSVTAGYASVTGCLSRRRRRHPSAHCAN